MYHDITILILGFLLWRTHAGAVAEATVTSLEEKPSGREELETSLNHPWDH